MLFVFSLFKYVNHYGMVWWLTGFYTCTLLNDMNSCSVFCTQFNIKVINVGQTLHKIFFVVFCCGILYDHLGDFDRLQFISITFAYALNFHDNVLDQFRMLLFRINQHLSYSYIDGAFYCIDFSLEERKKNSVFEAIINRLSLLDLNSKLKLFC